MNQVFNFSSGPAMLPKSVLLKAEKELRNWHHLGTSVMEISHRSKEFIELAQSSEQDLRDILSIPENYNVLFCQGGARAQFAAVPMNLLGTSINADYIDGGYWAHSAIKEAKKYCNPKIIYVASEIKGLRTIKPMRDWELSNNSAYIHYCPNETIDGIAIYELPDFGKRVVVADFSSTILSQPLDINRFGVIYACAQKNIGPAGLTLVIIRKDLLLRQSSNMIPSILDYSLLAKNNSMFNTPPTFSWYVAGLVFKWIKKQGGLVEMDKRNKAKASLLYHTIDNSDFYCNTVAPSSRSCMNVPFTLADNKLESLFLQESMAAGLYALKGHRVIGGLRASLYNAMPMAGVQTLVDFMLSFVRRYG